MRGKDASIEKAAVQNGITPAYAGKSAVLHDFAFHFWDHPRLCGEKRRSRFHCPAGSGSPPPMRGKVVQTIVGVIGVRITPAYAGKSV